MSLISSRTSPIFWERSPRASERCEIASTCSCMSRIVSPVWPTANEPALALSAIDPAVARSSSAVAATCATAADCWLVAVEASVEASSMSLAARVSASALVRTPSSSVSWRSICTYWRSILPKSLRMSLAV
jgi:hypothetical protein